MRRPLPPIFIGDACFPTCVRAQLGEVAGASVPKIEELLRTNGAKEVRLIEQARSCRCTAQFRSLLRFALAAQWRDKG